MKRFATSLIILMLFHAALIVAQDTPVEVPTEAPSSTPTASPFLLPTSTPVGDWVDAASATGAFVRAGPGLRFPVVTSLPNGTVVEPVGRDQEKGWIMLRVGDGFGWLLRPLVRWVTDLDALPILYIGALTPSPTYTSSATFTPTATSTTTSTPTDTATSTYTYTPTATFTPTSTLTLFPSNTPLPTLTLTAIPSATFTNSPTATATLVPTLTFTSTSTDTATLVPTNVPTQTFTSLPTASPTLTPTDVSPSPTFTPLPTVTETPTTAPLPTEPPVPTFEVTLPTAMLLSTAAPSSTPLPIIPSDTPTIVASPTDLPSTTPLPTNTATQTATDAPVVLMAPTGVPPTQTATVVATETVEPTSTETSTTIPTPLPTQTFTPLPSETPTGLPSPTVQIEPIIVAAEPTVTAQSSPAGENPSPNDPALIDETVNGSQSISGEAVVAGVILLAVAGYGALYWRGASAVDRYADGFVVDECPVCKRGALHVETHIGRVLGVPQPRSVVTCDNCRSVLREVGRKRWRYAVDRAANPMLYGQFNGRIVDEDKLVNLSVWNQTLDKPPTFEDDSS